MIKKEMIDRFLILHAQGHSLRKMARQTSVSPNSVKKYLVLYNRKCDTHNIVRNLRSQDPFLIGTYVGLWAGDGTQYYDKGYTIKICCHSEDQELIAYIQKLLLRLFGKTSTIGTGKRHQATIRFKSKFIYSFINAYVRYEENKTHTVRLLTRDHPDEFFQGYFLGLMLSDGHLDKKLHFNSTSSLLADDMRYLLQMWRYHPREYVHYRKKYGWHDLYMVSLTTKESRKVCELLDAFLSQSGYAQGFRHIKRYRNSENADDESCVESKEEDNKIFEDVSPQNCPDQEMPIQSIKSGPAAI
jgi:hypothetical protein